MCSVWSPSLCGRMWVNEDLRGLGEGLLGTGLGLYELFWGMKHMT